MEITIHIACTGCWVVVPGSAVAIWHIFQKTGFGIVLGYCEVLEFSKMNLLQLQAMVGGLFGGLLLLVGTCSAWHDSYHGEHFITLIMTHIMVSIRSLLS